MVVHVTQVSSPPTAICSVSIHLYNYEVFPSMPIKFMHFIKCRIFLAKGYGASIRSSSPKATKTQCRLKHERWIGIGAFHVKWDQKWPFWTSPLPIFCETLWDFSSICERKETIFVKIWRFRDIARDKLWNGGSTSRWGFYRRMKIITPLTN